MMARLKPLPNALAPIIGFALPGLYGRTWYYASQGLLPEALALFTQRTA